MYYDIPEITDLAATLAAKTASGSSSMLSTMLNIPSFDGFSKLATTLLSQNIVQLASDGTGFLPNPTIVSTIIRDGVANITPSINSDATAMFNSIAGKIAINPTGVVTQAAFNNTENVLATIAQTFSKSTSTQVVSLFNTNNDAAQYGSISNAVGGALQENSNLSSKGIRDLSNATIFQEKVNKTVADAQFNTTQVARQAAVDGVNNPIFDRSSQTSLHQISSPEFSGDNDDGYELYVRRTVYWAYGPGTDYDSAALRSSTGRQLEQGTSAAVDPAFIPYLSRIEFPDIGTRYATDTGGAVKARAASAGSAPVIDVFFLNKSDAIAFANKSSDYITVRVYPPKSSYKYAANSSPTYGVA